MNDYLLGALTPVILLLGAALVYLTFSAARLLWDKARDVFTYKVNFKTKALAYLPFGPGTREEKDAEAERERLVRQLSKANTFRNAIFKSPTLRLFHFPGWIVMVVRDYRDPDSKYLKEVK